MAVTLPVVLLILDWYPFNRLHSLKTIWSAFFEKFPFVIMSLASSIITLMAQSSGASVASLEFVPLLSRVLVAANSIIAYLGKMLLPLDLIPFYPYPKSASLLSIQYLSALVLVIVITAASAAVAKRHRVWLSVWGYYVVTLMPVLGLVQVGNQAMADRYAYLPSIGPFLAAGSVIAWLVNEVNKRHSGGIMAKFPYMVTVVCLIVPLSYLTFKQIGIWENGYVLWNHTIQRGFESATAYNNRGLSLDEMGQQDKALADFGRAITLDPRNYFAYNNTGVIYGKEGQYQRSIEYFLKAIAINPGHADSYCNLGLSYFNVKRYDKAMENYNAAIRLKQNFDMAYLNRGNLYLTAGDKRHAMADYQKSCTLGNKNACELANLVSRE
jgi:tetratricopeptide (TPR) repeat protein